MVIPAIPPLFSSVGVVAALGGFGGESAGGFGVAAAVGEGEPALFFAAAAVGPDAGAVFVARRSAVRTGVLSGATGVESLATASKSAVRWLLVDSGAGGGESTSGVALAALAAVVLNGAGRGAGGGAGEGEGVGETGAGPALPMEGV